MKSFRVVAIVAGLLILVLVVYLVNNVLGGHTPPISHG